MDNSQNELEIKNQWNMSKHKGIINDYFEKAQIKEIDDFQIHFINGFHQAKREPQIDDGLNIYVEFDSEKFNFNKILADEILFYLNLESEQMINRKAMTKMKKNSNFKELIEEDTIIGGAVHQLVGNQSPILSFHSILLPYPEEELPQIINSEIIRLVFQMFKICETDQLKIGFNSVGAFATVNHLHLQIIFQQSLLSIEKQKTVNILKVQTDEECCYIELSLLDNDYLRVFCIEYGNKETEVSKVHDNISYAAGIIIDILIAANIPHNIIFTQRCLFIIPRKFQQEQTIQHQFRTGFLELAGMIVCKDQESFDNFDIEQYKQVLRESVSLQDEQIQNILKQIKERI